MVLCNTVTDYDSTFGDSGSPVFTRKGGDSNSVELVGISWGITGEGESVFSPINAVFSELFPGLSELERHNSVVHLCGRTQEVLDGILAVAGQGVTCEEATGRDLASVTDLDLRNRGIGTP